MRLEKQTNAFGSIFRLQNGGQIMDTVLNSEMTCRYPLKGHAYLNWEWFSL